MRLSEAMMLGSTTCKMVPGDWNSCALGCAGNAVGIEEYATFQGRGREEVIAIKWPWIEARNDDGNRWMGEIWYRFDHDVCDGNMTLEQLVDYVRSIEPECGTCNSFQCSCPKTAAVTEGESTLVHA